MTTLNIGGEGGNSFPFDNIGDQVSGQIIDMVEQQQTDLKDGTPKFFDSGQPMMMYRVTLQTQLRDSSNPMDDGRRSVYLKGSRKPESQSSLAAVVGAVQAATGTSNLATGGLLTLQYIGVGEAQRGFSPPKKYAAAYQAPVMGLGGQQPAQQQPNGWDQPAQPQQQAPAPQQQFVQPQIQPAAPVQQQVAVPPIQQYAQGGPVQPPAPQVQQPAPQAPAPVANQQEIAAAMANLGITPEQIAQLAAQNAAQGQPVG